MLLKDHIEANFFVSKKIQNKYDDKYFNEHYVKETTENINYDYNVCCLNTMFKILKTLETQCLYTLDNENQNKSTHALIPEKKTNKKDPQNLIDYFMSSHLQNICRDLYDLNSQVNNYEIENKLCLSLFLIKKIIKDYSFYFNKMELENIYVGLKKFKK